jgi:hypothetical protein
MGIILGVNGAFAIVSRKRGSFVLEEDFLAFVKVLRTV